MGLTDKAVESIVGSREGWLISLLSLHDLTGIQRAAPPQATTSLVRVLTALAPSSEATPTSCPKRFLPFNTMNRVICDVKHKQLDNQLLRYCVGKLGGSSYTHAKHMGVT